MIYYIDIQDVYRCINFLNFNLHNQIYVNDTIRFVKVFVTFFFIIRVEIGYWLHISCNKDVDESRAKIIWSR